MRKFWIVFLIIAVILVGGLGLLWKAATSLSQQDGGGKGGVLHWRLAGPLPEAIDDSFLGQLQGGDLLTFRQAVLALDRAASDAEVKAVVLELDGLAVSWAQLEELHAAVGAIRAAGKPVWSLVSFAGNADYALAAAADHVVMVPEGNLMVLGVSAELAFLRDTLAKVGVEAEFLHVGEYKSAPEQMTRREATDANRDMTRSLVNERYDQLVDLIASGRQQTPEQVASWIDVGMYDGEAALAAGLVDALGDLDEVLDELFPDEDVADFQDYALAGGGGGKTRHTVALVVAEGAIMPGESRQDPLQGTVMGSDTVIEQLADAREDDTVDAVLLRVDSPGGSAMASDLIWEAVRQVQENKPVIVSMSGMAASGGYYISCRADSIFADPGTLTGSIGVYAGKMSRSAMYEKIGIHREFITRGENALLFSDEGGFTDAQRTLFQNQMDTFYERFLGKVAAGRDMERDAAHAVAQGRVWTGRQGLEAGLVDGLGGLYRALDSAKWTLGLSTDDRISVVTFGEDLSPLERMLLRSLRKGGGLARLGSWLGAGSGSPWPWPVVLETLRDDGFLAAATLMDGRPVAMLPYSLQIR